MQLHTHTLTLLLTLHIMGDPEALVEQEALGVLVALVRLL
jgi:hypothetical protein